MKIVHLLPITITLPGRAQKWTRTGLSTVRAIFSWDLITAIFNSLSSISISRSQAMAEADEQPPPSTLSTASSTAPIYIHPRREPFQHGLLPISKLIFTDGTQTLLPIRDKLLSLTSGSALRANFEAIAEALQISHEHARLVLETIASVLHSDSDPIVTAKPSEIGSVGVNVFDLMLFLHIQSYKRLLPKGHKDSAAVADVWPSTSAFDGFLSALSPLQVRSLCFLNSIPLCDYSVYSNWNLDIFWTVIV